jgi:class I fructose-bisphosphate aldolase
MLEPFYCRSQEGRLTIDLAPDKIRYAAIIAADFSVPLLKIPFPDGPSRSVRRKSFRDIVESVSSKVLVLGGKKGTTRELLTRAEDSMREGACGLVIGRNVLLDQNPGLVADALRRIVHEDESAEAALRNATSEAG